MRASVACCCARGVGGMGWQVPGTHITARTASQLRSSASVAHCRMTRSQCSSLRRQQLYIACCFRLMTVQHTKRVSGACSTSGSSTTLHACSSACEHNVQLYEHVQVLRNALGVPGSPRAHHLDSRQLARCLPQHTRCRARSQFALHHRITDSIVALICRRCASDCLAWMLLRVMHIQTASLTLSSPDVCRSSI